MTRNGPIICESCGHNCTNNAQLSLQQIAQHGVDRYPTVGEQMIKLVEEVGELAKEVNRDNRQKARAEAADVALALYNLARKLDFNLDSAIFEKVMNDRRKFVNEITIT